MLDVNALRNGSYYKEDGQLFVVMSYDHIKMGRGTATIKLKVKNLETGSIIAKSYTSGKRVEEAHLDTLETEFKYRTNTDYVFEDEDGEEIELSKDQIGDQANYLKKSMNVRVLMYEDEPLSISLPIKVSYKVKEAPPDARGNSANASYKDVVLENNFNVRAPMFIKAGDKIIIDTRDGSYVSRDS